ncbi:MAG TPA: site-specific integrase [Terriglobales bacterium]|nr:site-specific integrase [Terriglobales bacterium]
MGRIQTGYVYEASGALYIRYWTTEIVDGKPQRVQRSEYLCDVDERRYISRVKKKGEIRLVLSSGAKLARNEFMQRINSQNATRRPGQDMPIVAFWETRFLPYCKEIVALTGEPRRKPSTISGYEQIWNQHLKHHFGETTLQEYEPSMGMEFLQSLTATQNKTTLKHIKALGSSVFKRAVIERRIKMNPWHEVEIPDDAIEPEPTEHYTLEEAEDLISALKEHVDCQLILALSCFLGLRPGEIAALKWEDIDGDWIHIRRSVVNGEIGTPKTIESTAPIPIIDQVRVPLELWRQKSGKSSGWVFESRNATPIDLHNLIARVIRPHVEGPAFKRNRKSMRCVRCGTVPEASGVRWKELYAGRRGAVTAVIEANNGNLAMGQALLRHKSQVTTATFYKKQITPRAFKEGMKLLQAAANRGDK